MCLLGPMFGTGPTVDLVDVHLGVSLSDRKFGSHELRP